MMRNERSLAPEYFEGLFAADPDPWKFETSEYEAAKYERTVAGLSAVRPRGGRYRKGFEVGCANGVLTRRLAALCDSLLAIDVSPTVLSLARARCPEPAVRFAEMVFPKVTPDDDGFDLVVLSEVAYYWDDPDLARAASWLGRSVVDRGILILVHWTGETNYPQTADGAVHGLRHGLGEAVEVLETTRYPEYRLDLWRLRANANR